ncbi:DUF4184 family protein [Acinetobacter tianfuensis]|uniref:DUF4184 family protein n=1 Tax=Acinetobacter tianfuensis TaxID=2419603 RepID=A0A3A8ER34_9GAMM|nr:DUF4184 family protein [Acinetobacter tianfuensis]RKG32434.1 DUF4184 family protein [Acinetobacter tianfuensis]
MPFTISHAVLAPPLSKLSGGRLPIAALAIGCMVPDLFRLFTNANYDGSHQWSGLIVPNLLLGLMFCLLWYAFYRPMLFAFFGLHKPLNLHGLNQCCGFILSLIIAIIIGTSTHILWDGLTHVDFRTFAFKETLSLPVALFGSSYPLHRVLQIGLSIFALPILAWMIYRHHLRYRSTDPVNKKTQIYVYGLSLLSLTAGIASYLYFADSAYSDAYVHDLYAYIGKSINYFFRAFLAIFTLGSLIFVILNAATNFFTAAAE